MAGLFHFDEQIRFQEEQAGGDPGDRYLEHDRHRLSIRRHLGTVERGACRGGVGLDTVGLDIRNHGTIETVGRTVELEPVYSAS